MTSEDRKGSLAQSDANQEHPSGASGPRTLDTGASDQVTEGTDVTSGKGRRDEVGHTGIYPASSASEVPGDAELVTPGEFGTARAQLSPGEQSGDGPALDASGSEIAGGESSLQWMPGPNIVPEGERSDR